MIQVPGCSGKILKLTHFFFLKVVEKLLNKCCLGGISSLGLRITESQNGRGWKGPLWVI